MRDSRTAATEIRSRVSRRRGYIAKGDWDNFMELEFKRDLKDRQLFWISYFRPQSGLLQDGVRNPGGSGGQL